MSAMLRTCQYCMGYHRLGERCPQHVRVKTKTAQVQLRNSGRWQRTRRAVKERDMHLCRVCLTGRHNTQRAYNSHELEVHHIVPLSVDIGLAHEMDNLINLCRYHHKLVHDDVIGADELRAVISKPPGPLDP